jgi:hypothetical protein
MKRIAFVVEGKTEQIFVQEFIQQLSTSFNCHVALKYLHRDQILEVSTRGPHEEDATSCIWIINAEGDDKTLSFIEDHLEYFKRKGFHAIFGLRDRYSGSKQKPRINPSAIDGRTAWLTEEHGLRIEVTVAIEEIEAWFLSVPSFFLAYHESLTEEQISQVIGYDIIGASLEAIEHPAGLIDKVLQSVGLRYRKRESDSYKIAKNLDYDTLYLERPKELPPLARFTEHLNWSIGSAEASM